MLIKITRTIKTTLCIEYFLKKIKEKLHNTLLCHRKYPLEYIYIDITYFFLIASYNSC